MRGPRIRVTRAMLLRGGVWLLTLACGHRAARPQVKNVFVGELPAPRQIECSECARGQRPAWGTAGR